MRYEVVVAKDAQDQFGKLDARWRSRLKQEMRAHLEHEPKRESKSRIKRLRGLRQPQYRMRVDDMRIFYDETFLQKIARARDQIKHGDFVALDKLPD